MESPLQVPPSNAGFFSSAKRMSLPVGAFLEADSVSGYPIDMRVKADQPKWPPDDAERFTRLWCVVAQYGLGQYDRWLGGEGEEWLAIAVEVGRYLMERQQPDGSWLHRGSFAHTFPLEAGWRSGMAQGEAASLLVRLHLATGEQAFAEAALAALRPMALTVPEGGVGAPLDGGLWLEEYPTKTPSYVLNGAIFALWGLHDVGLGLNDSTATASFERGVDLLAANLHRFDTGWWSLYCLYPFPIRNVASSFYHALHIAQLEAMQVLAPRPEFELMKDRWTWYFDSPPRHRRAFAKKVMFRLVVPRNRLLAQRLPWARA